MEKRLKDLRGHYQGNTMYTTYFSPTHHILTSTISVDVDIQGNENKSPSMVQSSI